MKYADLRNRLNFISLPNFDLDPDPIAICPARLHRKIENLFTYTQLTVLINFVPEADAIVQDWVIERIQLLLAKRWACIRGTSLDYTVDSRNPINQACLQIADLLSEARQDKSRFEYLMPTLDATESPITGENIGDNEFQITDFIISDDYRSLIHVGHTLAYAEEDATMKHPFLLTENHQPITLTQHEQQRVQHHSQHALAYWKAILSRYRFRKNGATMGGALKQLIDKLREGGKHQQGTELNAGDPANIGIQTFFDKVYNTLGASDQNRLNQIKRDNVTDETLGTLLHYLQHPEKRPDEDELSATYCIELIAGKIETILADNEALLYEWCIDAEIPSETLETYEQNLNNARQAFKDHQKTAHTNPLQTGTRNRNDYPEVTLFKNRLIQFLQAFATEPIEFPQSMPLADRIIKFLFESSIVCNFSDALASLIQNSYILQEILEILPHLLQTRLLESLDDRLDQIIQNTDEIRAILTILPEALQQKTIRSLRQKFNLEDLIKALPYEQRLNVMVNLDTQYNTITNTYKLNSLLKLLPVDQRCQFISKRRDQILEIIQNTYQVESFLKIFPENQRLHVITDLVPELLRVIEDGYQLSDILEILPEEDRAQLINTLGHRLSQYIQDSLDIRSMLNPLPLSQKFQLLAFLSPESLKKIEYPFEFLHTLDEFPENSRLSVIKYLRHQAVDIIDYNDQIVEVLEKLPETDRLPFLTYFKHHKTPQFTNVFEIKDILSTLPHDQRFQFIQYFWEDIFDLTQNQYGFSRLFDTLPQKHQTDLVQAVLESNPDFIPFISNKDMFRAILNGLPEQRHTQFIKKISDQIPCIVRHQSDFKTIAEKISIDARKDFIQALNHHLSSIFKDLSELGDVIKLFNHETQKQLFSAFGKNRLYQYLSDPYQCKRFLKRLNHSQRHMLAETLQDELPQLKKHFIRQRKKTALKSALIITGATLMAMSCLPLSILLAPLITNPAGIFVVTIILSSLTFAWGLSFASVMAKPIEDTMDKKGAYTAYQTATKRLSEVQTSFNHTDRQKADSKKNTDFFKNSKHSRHENNHEHGDGDLRFHQAPRLNPP